jgi:4-alpha-glucanotransferase
MGRALGHRERRCRPRPERLTTALERLARACGVHTSGPGADGSPRAVPEETLRRILGALGIAAESDADVAASLTALERQAWESAAPPVVVVRADAAGVPVTLQKDTPEVGVTLAFENGTERHVTQEFAAMELLEARAVDGRAVERRLLRLGTVPWGYHRLKLTPGNASTELIATPARCYLPERKPDERLWGVSAQLYLLRSEHNFGIGDFTDLRSLVALVAAHGGDIVGINPLHMPFPDDPEHASPYSPASRLLLNVLNVDVAALPELAECDAARELLESAPLRESLRAARDSKTVDYTRVAQIKTRVLETLFEALGAPTGASGAEFDAFRRRRGPAFERHCLYFALRRQLLARGHSRDWRAWPEALRDCRSSAVAQFAAEHSREVFEVAWQQWIADRQLEAAAHAGSGMRVGLYRDLAVGADAAGAETWSEPEVVVPGMSIGAPPDAFSDEGQDWGLPPLDPLKLRAHGYRPFIELLRANMRHAGALRIDHAMALQRLFFVPHGARPIDGAYVDYPREDLLGILALESQRSRCAVIGEDLGTVPVGFRVRMGEANVLSYRVLSFERDADGALLSPAEYPQLAIAVWGNHDLPTLAGWWDCADIELQRQAGVLTGEQREAALRERRRDKRALCAALRDEGLLGPSEEPSMERLSTAVHRLLGRTHALLATAQLDDIALEREPVNMPSTPRHPNWRRKLGKSLEELAASPRLAAQLRALAAERGAAAETQERP